MLPQAQRKNLKLYVFVVVVSIIIVVLVCLIIVFYQKNIQQQTPDTPSLSNIIENAEASNPEDVQRWEEYRKAKLAEVMKYEVNNTYDDALAYLNSLIDAASQQDELCELWNVKMHFYKLYGKYIEAIDDVERINVISCANEQKYYYYSVISGIYSDIGGHSQQEFYYQEAMKYITSAVTQKGGS